MVELWVVVKRLVSLIVGALLVVSCAGDDASVPSVEGGFYESLFAAGIDDDITEGSLVGIYEPVSSVNDGRRYLVSQEESQRFRYAIEDNAYHVAVTCQDGVVIGATIDVEFDDPDHIRFAGFDAESHEPSGIPACRVRLDAVQWGGPASWSMEGRRLVLHFAGSQDELTLWKITD